MQMRVVSDVREGQIPASAHLWDLATMQAKAKFSKWPSPAASGWVRKRYIELGGRFVSSVTELSPREKKDHDESEQRKSRDGSRNDRTPKDGQRDF